MMFFLTLAFIGYILEERGFKENIARKKELIKRSFSPVSKTGGAVLISASIFVLYFGNIAPAKAAWYFVHAINSPLEEAIPLYQKGIRISQTSQWEVAWYFAGQRGSDGRYLGGFTRPGFD